MKHSNYGHFCNLHFICTNCSPCQASPKNKKICFAVFYTILLIVLAFSVYAATTITLHKAGIAPQSPSDLSCTEICPPDYGYQVDIERCCTSESAFSCKTKLQCKEWILQHDRNYVVVAYAYITLFCCIVVVHVFISLKKKCEKDSQGKQPQERSKVLRWKNKHGVNSLEEAMFQNQTKCQVCLKEVVPKKVITLTCCKALVHSKCLKGWLQEIDNCPSCGTIMEAPSPK